MEVLRDEFKRSHNGQTLSLDDVFPATFEYKSITGEMVPVELSFEHVSDKGKLDWTRLDIPDLATYLAMRSHNGLAYEVELFNEEWAQELEALGNENMLKRGRENGVPEHSIRQDWVYNTMLKQWQWNMFSVFIFQDLSISTGSVLKTMMTKAMNNIYHAGDPFVFWNRDRFRTVIRFVSEDELNTFIEDLFSSNWLLEYDDDYYDFRLPDSSKFDYLQECEMKYIFNLRKFHKLLDIERTIKQLNLPIDSVPLMALTQAALLGSEDDRGEWEYALNMENWGYYEPKMLDVKKVRSMERIDDWNEVVIPEEDWERNILKVNHGKERTLDDVLPFRSFIEISTDEVKEVSFSFEQIDEYGELNISLLDEDDCVLSYAYSNDGEELRRAIAEFNNVWREDMKAYILSKNENTTTK